VIVRASTRAPRRTPPPTPTSPSLASE
jgi:hypothetical protein